jgi:hypothetical protein
VGKMLLKNLINIADYNDVWTVIEKEYKPGKEAFHAYKTVIEELKILKPKPCEPPITCVVAKLEDWLSPGEFIFDVFGLINGDENHYALEMNSWNEWLGYDILNKSIEVYGQAEVLAHILYEMTFFGFSSKTVHKRAEKERRFLEKSYKEIQNGTAKFVKFDDFLKEEGCTDKRTPKEKQKERRQYRHTAAKNEITLKMLLGKNSPPAIKKPICQ